MTDPNALARADEAVAVRFTRVMNASTSPRGMWSDPPLVAAMTAPLVLGWIALLRFVDKPLVSFADTAQIRYAALAVVLLPLAVAIGISVSLMGARSKVVAWLASVPFPVDNLNAVLNGIGELLVVRFAEAPPPNDELNRLLEAVSPDTFVTKRDDETHEVELRIGVVDSKRNPAKTNHQRYARVKRVVDEVLVPLAARARVESVRVE